MRKFLAPAMAAITLAGALGAAATPVEARDYRHGYYGGGYYGGYDRGYNRRDNHGDAVAAGVIGLALGAALASSSNHNSYSRSYYGEPRGYYYDRPYAYDTCVSRRWVYDPYIGREVLVRQTYAC
ncbi:MAG: hypothetical protein JWQ97_3190 [Phenylobacterium sp.]|nr:hypothetical protein [Phenylobacterium sp.]